MVELGSDLDWYAVATRPRAEAKVSDGLGERGLRRFLPRYTKVAKLGGRMRFVPRTVFPGYVFTAFAPGRACWAVVRETPGVIGPVVHGDGAPWRLPATDIGDLMARCALGQFDEDKRRIGASVKFSTVKIGPLISRISRHGWIVGLEDDGIVRVLFGNGEPGQIERMHLDELETAEYLCRYRTSGSVVALSRSPAPG